jgi:hypothetical protein
MSALDDRLAFLEALQIATEQGAVTWRMVEDDERDLYEASVDGEAITVERLMLHSPRDGGGERVFVRVVGLKVWEVFAIGTVGYDMVMSMLSVNIFGWKDGHDGHIKSLRKATVRVRALLSTE